MRASLIAGFAWIALSVSALAFPAQDLSDTLKLDEVTAIMMAEGLDYADDLEQDMLPDGGGDYWDRQVRRIYAPGLMEEALTRALSDNMTDADRALAADFFGSPQGQSILDYENAARAAMSDPDIEEIARATYQDMQAGADPRLDQLTVFIDVNDLIERNVAGALSSNYQFFRGLADGGAYGLTEDQILADVWSQEQEIRDDTTEWLFGFLNMAYAPLSDADLEAYIAFSETEAGRALNGALFAGFDVLYRDISYALGLAVAQAMTGSDL